MPITYDRRVYPFNYPSGATASNAYNKTTYQAVRDALLTHPNWTKVYEQDNGISAVAVIKCAKEGSGLPADFFVIVHSHHSPTTQAFNPPTIALAEGYTGNTGSVSLAKYAPHGYLTTAHKKGLNADRSVSAVFPVLLDRAYNLTSQVTDGDPLFLSFPVYSGSTAYLHTIQTESTFAIMTVIGSSSNAFSGGAYDTLLGAEDPMPVMLSHLTSWQSANVTLSSTTRHPMAPTPGGLHLSHGLNPPWATFGRTSAANLGRGYVPGASVLDKILGQTDLYGTAPAGHMTDIPVLNQAAQFDSINPTTGATSTVVSSVTATNPSTLSTHGHLRGWFRGLRAMRATSDMVPGDTVAVDGRLYLLLQTSQTVWVDLGPV